MSTPEPKFSITHSSTVHRFLTTSKPSTRSKAHLKLLPTWTPLRRWESVLCSEITSLKTMWRVTTPTVWPRTCSTSPYRRHQRSYLHSRPRGRLRAMPACHPFHHHTPSHKLGVSPCYPLCFVRIGIGHCSKQGVLMRSLRIFSAHRLPSTKHVLLFCFFIALFAAQAQQTPGQQDHP